MLEVKNLSAEFTTQEGSLRAVDGISFSVSKGKTLGIVGESGCGKTVTSLSVLRLLPFPGRISGGEILFQGQDLLHLPVDAMRAIRGSKIAMIFQEPMSALNPVFTVGEQVASILRLHHPQMSAMEARSKALNLFRLVNLPDPENRYHEYPHQLSGGMQQRVLIAMAVSCEPQLLIADEPTTALDVTIQAQILDLMQQLKRELQLSLILITHDLGVIADMCDDVVVMYAGQIVESGSVNDIFQRPLHPYTRGLLDSIPLSGAPGHLKGIPGMVPSLTKLPQGCRFQDRCSRRQELCRLKNPELNEHPNFQKAACHFPLLEGGTK